MDQARQPGDVSGATRRAEEDESGQAHEADRPPTPDEEAAAEDQSVDAEVREHYEDMTERGVRQEGEGRIS